jgi:TolB-like protein
MDARRFLFGAFTLDAARGVLLRDGVPQPAGHRAIALLTALAKANGQVVSKAELIDAAWPRAVVEESNLSVQIAALRKLLNAAGEGHEAIATVARVGYRLSLPIETETGDAQVRGRDAPAEARPSIAVLPFANLSGDPSQDYFAAGMTEDVIMALSRFRWFRVVGRSASYALQHRRLAPQDLAAKLAVRYLLEGSVRKSGGRVRLNLQLMEGADGTQLWGEHYDFTEHDLPAVQDTIVARVAGAVEPELLKVASENSPGHAPAGQAGVMDRLYRGIWLFHRVEREGHGEARELFREVCRIAPGMAQAHYWLARVNAGMVAYGWSEAEAHDIEEGLAAAAAAIRSDEKSPYAHYALAITSAYAAALEQSARASQRAIELAPGFALGHLVLGMARLYAGDAKSAIAPLQEGLHLNAFDPQNFVWFTALAYAHLFDGRAELALAASRRAQEVRPGWAPALRAGLCALRVQGEHDAARDCAAQIARLPPGGADPLSPMRRHNPLWDEAISRWLAGN